MNYINNTDIQPPTACDTMPTNHVIEWYFESVRKCLIPRKGFGDGLSEDTNKFISEPKKKTITAQDGVCTQLITFSFHIEQEDEMGCYIIVNGQTSMIYIEYFILYN